MRVQDTVGFVGLGNIGAPIAERIVGAGFDVVVWNRSPDKMQTLVAAGARPAPSARRLGEQTDIVFTCVSSTGGLEEVLFGSQGLVGDHLRASLVVDISTLPPEVEREMGRRLQEQAGIELIDVPVSGGSTGARAGTLAAMAGGKPDLLERARPVLSSFASRITHMGPLGAGQATKACNQIISIGTMGAIAEALAVGENYGIDTHLLASAVAGGFGDSIIMRELERSFKDRDSSAIRAIIEALTRASLGTAESDCQRDFSLVLKDLGIAMDIGRSAGTPMPLTTHMENVFRALHRTPHEAAAK